MYISIHIHAETRRSSLDAPVSVRPVHAFGEAVCILRESNRESFFLPLELHPWILVFFDRDLGLHISTCISVHVCTTCHPSSQAGAPSLFLLSETDEEADAVLCVCAQNF